MAGIATGGGEECLQTPKDWKLAEQSTGQTKNTGDFRKTAKPGLKFMQELKAHSTSEKRQVDDQRMKTVTESIDFAVFWFSFKPTSQFLGLFPTVQSCQIGISNQIGSRN
ncbi:hypothetical protein GB937_005849 [Aspergillus fischeri]|nr:hypothetical protein GB937_005849 [Aspergillus fischeri]